MDDKLEYELKKARIKQIWFNIILHKFQSE